MNEKIPESVEPKKTSFKTDIIMLACFMMILTITVPIVVFFSKIDASNFKAGDEVIIKINGNKGVVLDAKKTEIEILYSTTTNELIVTKLKPEHIELKKP